MEHLTSKPPSSAREYYVNLFCSKYKLKPSKGSHGVRKALKSWWSLSTAERQPFVDKFNLMQEKIKENCVKYLKSVKPFMKKKIIGEGNGHCVSEHVISQEDNSEDINGSIHNEDTDQNNQDHAASVIFDPYPNDPASSHEIINATEKVLKLPEPTLPCAKNGKELFEMVTNATGENNLEWKDLSQVEKYKYRSAVFAIKREYIKEYQNYLESLPPVQ
ncbi:hypothetical protein MSG28_010959 [Choristoneura fumiferana]|uniref:Uncharacterized protein n=1 Tax=Choristoneura fumiferana TaxID=7141 RepID=A0ACC0KPE4_CHOFU|nr:hypothetical protein MSG28_010959 [Choristoneura fumiferana]